MALRLSPPRPKRCPSCGTSDLRSTEVCANGGHGPTLLPGLGRMFQSAKFELLLCVGCGHVSFFALPEMLQNLAERPGRWRRVS